LSANDPKRVAWLYFLHHSFEVFCRLLSVVAPFMAAEAYKYRHSESLAGSTWWNVPVFNDTLPESWLETKQSLLKQAEVLRSDATLTTQVTKLSRMRLYCNLQPSEELSEFLQVSDLHLGDFSLQASPLPECPRCRRSFTLVDEFCNSCTNAVS
jgi:isoleucyl-tRNA synthetase